MTTGAHPGTQSADTEKITIERCTGPKLAGFIPALADLRVTVFRAWPYLYDGDPGYEAAYLRTYLDSEKSAVILAWRGSRIVGASTCLPLSDETANVQAPFLARGWNVADFFYFGESVLLPECRGQGVGVAFFREREAHATAISAARYAAFCAVQRPASDPRKPAAFVPLDEFWTRRGFIRRPDLTCQMDWKEVGQSGETTKTMMFWMKSLTGAPQP
jgi:GNAT superfamily N-acetyltransferase